MLLGFDTATPFVTVALHDGESVLATYSSEVAMRHGEMLAPGIAHVLADAGCTAKDLTGIAVGVGPGPFTGLRVGLVTARTMAAAAGLPVHGVCTLDILAAEAARADAGDDFTVATDARRREVYLARYRDGARLEGPNVLYPADAATDGPVAGTGPRLYPDSFPNAIAPEHPSAAVLCDLVVRRAVEVLPPEPLYLRRPDTMEPRPPKAVS